MSVDQLRKRILDSQLLPYTHQIVDVRLFLEENQRFFDKVQSLIHQSSTSQKINKIPHKSKSVSKFSLPRHSPPLTNSSLSSLSIFKKRNKFLQVQIKKLQKQSNEKHLQQNPRLQDLQQQISNIEKDVQLQNQINKQFKEVIQDRSELFEMYQKMCRRCEVIRKQNNQVSEQLKQCIQKINDLTGKDDNPNLFIMNFK